MKNSIDRSTYEDLLQHFDEDDEVLLADLEEVHRLPVPDLRFGARTAPAAPLVPARRRWWAPALALATASAALLLAGALLGGGTRSVDARAILAQAQTVAESGSLPTGIQSYRFDAQSYSPAGGPRLVYNSWFAGNEHVRHETSPDGDAADRGYARSGDELWIYGTGVVSGRPGVVYGPVEAFGPYGEGGRLAHQASGGVAGLVAAIADGPCWSAELRGEQEVAGRGAYVIEARHDHSCLVTRDSGGVVAAMAEGPSLVRLIWVDKESFITLRTETLAGDTLVHIYEVTDIAVNVDIPSEVFRYNPPSGATVMEVGSPEEARRALEALELTGG